MSLKCLFGHQWNGCKCERCGETRDEGHKWSLLDGFCIEKCSICGKERIIKHMWDGCKCKHCGKIRDEQHVWDGCRCDRCGKIRDTDHNFIPIDGKNVEKCTICGKERKIEGTKKPNQTENEESYQTTAIIKCKNCNNVCVIRTMGNLAFMLEFDLMPNCKNCGSKKYSIA